MQTVCNTLPGTFEIFSPLGDYKSNKRMKKNTNNCTRKLEEVNVILHYGQISPCQGDQREH